MAEMTYAQAIGQGLAEEMRRSSDVIAYGEDFRLSHAWPVSKGLFGEFGPDRVRDAPICENTQIGMAVGAAVTGLIPVVELQFADFAMLAADSIVNQAAKMTYMTGGQTTVNMVVRLPYGHLNNFAAQHSQVPYGMFANVPGLTICTPSTPADAKGLIKAAIRSQGPVLFFEHKALYGVKGEVPDGDWVTDIPSVQVYGDGDAATIVAIGWMVGKALKAQRVLSDMDIQVTVIDLRTLVPVDLAPILASVQRTGRLILADEAPVRSGYTAWLSSEIQRNTFDYLAAPPLLVGVEDVPIPCSPPLENAVIPNEESITSAVHEILNR